MQPKYPPQSPDDPNAAGRPPRGDLSPAGHDAPAAPVGAGSPRLEVRASGISGNGVYALTDIPAGALVTVCRGTEFSGRDCPSEGHALQIGDDLWLWSDGSSLDDSVNHSCDPNVGFSRGGLGLYSLRPIVAGEEIGWDYSTSIIEEGWSLECRCGAAHCRGTVLPFFSLASADRERLLPISLDFIRRRYAPDR